MRLLPLWIRNGLFILCLASSFLLPNVRTTHSKNLANDMHSLIVQAQNYEESFGTNFYKNFASQVDWNTSAGQLGLLMHSGGAHREPAIAPDGQGGLYVAWSDLRNNNSDGNWDVYAQHIDSHGNRLWQDDIRVNSDGGIGYQGIPTVRVDNQGNAVIGWIDDRVQPQGLSAQKLSPGGAKLWGPEDLRINSDNSFRIGWGSGGWSMSLDSAGDLWIAWQAAPDAIWEKSGIYCQRISPQGTKYWASDVLINNTPVYLPDKVDNTTISVAVNGQGQAIISWISKGNGLEEIRAQAVNQSGSLLWNSDVRVDQDIVLTSQGNPSVAFLAENQVVITWRRGPQDPPLDSGTSTIMAQKVDLTGNVLWAQDMRVNHGTTRVFRGHPQAVALDGSRVLVVWDDSRRGLGTIDIMAQIIDNQGNRQWTNDDHRVNPDNWVNWNIKPAVSVTPSLVQIAWNTDDDVFSQQFDSTTWEKTWQVPVLANKTDGKRDQVVPDIAQFDETSVITVWQDFRGYTSDIIAQKVDLEGSPQWPNPIQVNTISILDKRQNPRLAVNQSHIAFIVWQSEDGGIFGQVLDQVGNKLWPEDKRLDLGMAKTYNPEVINLKDGTFLVTWIEQRAPDSYLWDVKAQRFDQDGRRLMSSDIRANPTDNYVYEIDARSRPALAEDTDSKYIICWRNNTGAIQAYHLQRFNIDGTPAWVNPVILPEAPFDVSGYFENYGLALTASNEIYVATTVQKNGNFGIFLNKIGLDGALLWQPGVWAGSGSQPLFWGNPSMASIGDGGVLVSWDDEKTGQRNITVEKVTNTGTIEWSSAQLNRPLSWPLRPALSDKMSNSFMITWHDERTGDNNIYLRRIGIDGNLLWPQDRAIIQNEMYYYAFGSAESITVDTTNEVIPRATLNIDADLNGGRAQYFLSNNGSLTWEEVVPGIRHSFSSAGSDLRWKVILSPSLDFHTSPVIRSLSIRYVDNQAGDTYEPDDSCAEAQPITTDGSLQQHTFYRPNDEDWVAFQVTAGISYVVQTSGVQDRADTTLAVFGQCDGQPTYTNDNAFGQDARISWMAQSSGTVYVRAKNHSPEIYGPDTGYNLSIRSTRNLPVGLIITGYDSGYNLQANIQYSGDLAYRTMVNAGVPKSRIRYLGYGASRDVDGNGLIDDIYGVPSPTEVQDAILSWAPSVGVQAGVPFFIYLVDHGLVDRFKINGDSQNSILFAQDLNVWLTNLENRTRTDQITIIIEACKSGSFIDMTPAGPSSISGQNRVIITSTNSSLNAFPSVSGALFADAFWAAISENQNVEAAFVRGQQAVLATSLSQQPWLDDNGDAISNPLDGAIARSRGLIGSFAGTAPLIQEIFSTKTGLNQVRLQAKILDDSSVHKAWAILFPPSFTPPSPNPDGTTPTLNLPVYNLVETSLGFYETTINELVEKGSYRIVVYAEDDDGNQAIPQFTNICITCSTYLPIIIQP